MSENEKDPKTMAIQKITKFLDTEIVKARFAEVIGERQVGSYIASVMITVKDTPSLLACSANSIYSSALRAATLRVSVDPALGQAYLVPFKGTATLIVGYKGLYDMAVRTGKYRYINVGPIYQGQIVEENPITGFHTITGSIESGAKAQDKIIGWIGAFEMNPERGQSTGFGKTMYMTCEEIHQHAEMYSPGYNYKNSKGEFTSMWRGKEKRKMERKTVLRLLIRRWGYLDPADANALEEIEAESMPIDAQTSEIYDVPSYEEVDTEEQPRTEAQKLKEMGFGGNE